MATSSPFLWGESSYTSRMSSGFEIHLRDLGEPLVEAWNREFAGVESVTTSCGDIFSLEPGPVEPGAPIDVKADAIVSSANSFGFMDGGIDAVYTNQFGEGLQDRLQRATQVRERERTHGTLRTSLVSSGSFWFASSSL